MAHSSRVPLGRIFKDNLGGTEPGKYQAHSDATGAKVTPKAPETWMHPDGHDPRQGPEVKDLKLCVLSANKPPKHSFVNQRGPVTFRDEGQFPNTPHEGRSLCV